MGSITGEGPSLGGTILGEIRVTDRSAVVPYIDTAGWYADEETYINHLSAGVGIDVRLQ